MEYSFVFVVQEGSLEVKSMLLAASLKRQLRCSYELVAAIPEPRERWGRPADSTLAFLKHLGVRLEPISNGFNTDYPIGNKVSCPGVGTDADMRVFLDSDILAFRPFCGLGDSDMRGMEAPFGAVPASIDTFGADDALWALIYAGQNLTPPTERMRATVSGQSMLPYFNAGFIAVDSRVDFAATWLRIGREIEADPRVINKWPWLDQISLPVAMRYLGLDYVTLDERYNYPANLRAVGTDLHPYFVHYHNQKVLLGNPRLHRFVLDLAAEYPQLRDAMAASRKWRRLVRPAVRSIFSRYLGWGGRITGTCPDDM
jgi:hypothetical protein